MADFWVELTDRIVTAIKAVNTSVQKTQTYKDGNTYTLDCDETIEISGVGGVLGFLGVSTLLVAPTVVASSVSDSPLCISRQADGSLIAPSSITGSLSISTELGSSIVETTGAGGALGVLDVSTVMRGNIAASSSLNAYINRHLLDGSSGSASGTTGVLSVETGLVGVCEGAGSAVGSNVNLYL